MLQYDIAQADKEDLYTLRLRMPDGSSVNHTYHRCEPLSTVVRQVQYQTNKSEVPRLIVPPLTLDTSANLTLEESGLTDRTVINVSL